MGCGGWKTGENSGDYSPGSSMFFGNFGQSLRDQKDSVEIDTRDIPEDDSDPVFSSKIDESIWRLKNKKWPYWLNQITVYYDQEFFRLVFLAGFISLILTKKSQQNQPWYMTRLNINSLVSWSMKKAILILVLGFFLNIISNTSNANVVEELTKLNNLYKEGVINKEEFSKAKSILLLYYCYNC